VTPNVRGKFPLRISQESLLVRAQFRWTGYILAPSVTTIIELIVDLVVVGLIAGLLILKYPDLFWRIFPYLALIFFWRLTWRFLSEREGFKSWLTAVVHKRGRPMVCLVAFLIGGLLSVIFVLGVGRGLEKLAAEQKQFEPKPEPVPNNEKTEPSAPANISPPTGAKPALLPPAIQKKQKPSLDMASGFAHQNPSVPAAMPSTSDQEKSDAPKQAVIQPEHGNLAERADKLADDLDSFVSHRNQVLETNPMYKLKTKASYEQFAYSTDGEFRTVYEQRVLELQKEFADIHIKDEELDRTMIDIQEDQEMLKQMQNAALYTNLTIITEISQRLRVLARYVK
jgi:hypothetical protein